MVRRTSTRALAVGALVAAASALEETQGAEVAKKASGFQEALEALICKRLPTEIRKLSKNKMEEKAVDEPHWFLKQLSWSEFESGVQEFSSATAKFCADTDTFPGITADKAAKGAPEHNGPKGYGDGAAEVLKPKASSSRSPAVLMKRRRQAQAAAADENLAAMQARVRKEVQEQSLDAAAKISTADDEEDDMVSDSKAASHTASHHTSGKRTVVEKGWDTAFLEGPPGGSSTNSEETVKVANQFQTILCGEAVKLVGSMTEKAIFEKLPSTPFFDAVSQDYSRDEIVGARAAVQKQVVGFCRTFHLGGAQGALTPVPHRADGKVAVVGDTSRSEFDRPSTARTRWGKQSFRDLQGDEEEKAAEKLAADSVAAFKEGRPDDKLSSDEERLSSITEADKIVVQGDGDGEGGQTASKASGQEGASAIHIRPRQLKAGFQDAVSDGLFGGTKSEKREEAAVEDWVKQAAENAIANPVDKVVKVESPQELSSELHIAKGAKGSKMYADLSDNEQERAMKQLATDDGNDDKFGLEVQKLMLQPGTHRKEIQAAEFESKMDKMLRALPPGKR